MSYKIQTAAAYGWADLKSSDDGSDVYTTCLFATVAEAEAELKDIQGDDQGEWRIVTAETQAECDIY